MLGDPVVNFRPVLRPRGCTGECPFRLDGYLNVLRRREGWGWGSQRHLAVMQRRASAAQRRPRSRSPFTRRVSRMEDPITRIVSYVRLGVQHVVAKEICDVPWEVPCPGVMGSQAYLLAANDSDLDLYMVAPPEVIDRGRDLLICFSCWLQRTGKTRGEPVVQEQLETVKWTDARSGQDTSVLISDRKGVAMPVNVTSFLKEFYTERPLQRRLVKDVIAVLREKKVLNPHGLAAAIGQCLKTAPVALLCSVTAQCWGWLLGECTERHLSTKKTKIIANVMYVLRRCSSVHPLSYPPRPAPLCAGLIMENPTLATAESLYAALAQFDAFRKCVSLWWPAATTDAEATPRTDFKLQVRERTLHDGDDALVIQTRGRNCANRVTPPYWAHFQYTCYTSILTLPSTSTQYFPDLLAGVDPGFDVTSSSAGSPSQYRFRVAAEDEFVVVSFSAVAPAEGPGTTGSEAVQAGPPLGALLVLTGNGNRESLAAKGYRQHVVVTWRAGHQQNPQWLKILLAHLLPCLTARYGEYQVDLLGISRGAQAGLYAFHTHAGCPHVLDAHVRHVFLAGGCIWQRQDQSVLAHVLSGIRSCEPGHIAALVLSRMDATVRVEGKYSRKKKSGKGHRVDYGALVDQLQDHVAKGGVFVSNLASHSDVGAIVQGVISHVNQIGTLPHQPFDLVSAEMEASLLAVRRLPAEAETGAPQRQRLFAKLGLPAGRTPDARGDRQLYSALLESLRAYPLVRISGDTGAGKSTRIPPLCMAAHAELHPGSAGRRFGDCGEGSIAHCLPVKNGARSIFEYYCGHDDPDMRTIASTWNGDFWMYPRQYPFVVLCTPVALFHRLWNASAWSDIAFFIFDEVHCKISLVMLMVQYWAELYKASDARARCVKVILMTATHRGSPAVKAIEDTIAAANVPVGDVSVSRKPDSGLYERTFLWAVVAKPVGWADMPMVQRGCAAVAAMSKWLRTSKEENPQLLIIVPGEAELWAQRDALVVSEDLDFDWQVMVLCSETSKEDAATFRDCARNIELRTI